MTKRITVPADLDLHDVDAMLAHYAKQVHEAMDSIHKRSSQGWSAEHLTSRLVLWMAKRDELLQAQDAVEPIHE